MSINCKESLAMIDDHHPTVTGEAVRECCPALLHGSDLLAEGRLNFDAFSKHFDGKLRMLGLAKCARHLTLDRPLQFAPHAVQAGARWRVLRPGDGSSRYFVDHFLQP